MVSEEATPARYNRVLPQFKKNVKRPGIVFAVCPLEPSPFISSSWQAATYI